MEDNDNTTGPDIAELIADVLNHPDCPPEVANAIHAGLCELPVSADSFYDATLLRVMFFADPPRPRRRARKGGQ